MPTTTLMPLPKQQFFSMGGAPLAGGKVYTYEAGTSTPKETYTDPEGTIPQKNGIPLNLRGEPDQPIYWSGNYRVEVRDVAGKIVYVVDNFNSDPAGISDYVSGLLSVLPTQDGATKVGFIQSGLGAIFRNLQAKSRELFSLSDYGGAETGREDSDAEAKALKEATTARSLFRSLWMYKFPRRGIKVWKRTFGIKDKAAVVSINGGDDTTEPITQVLGFAIDSDVSVYGDRDHVGLFVQNTALPALVQTSATKFTATTVVSTDFGPVARSIQIGMLIDTSETPKKTGVITGFDAASNTITVSGWYIVDNSRGTATPADGTTIFVNPSTKVWALNANVLLPANAQANQVVGFELGLVNDKGDGMGYLYDAVNLGSKKGGTAFQCRANWVKGFHAYQGTQFGFISTNATTIGMYTQGGPVGFQADGATVISYLAKGAVNAVVVQDSAGGTKTVLDGAGRWQTLRLKYGAFAANATIDVATVVAVATGTPVNLPAANTNAERTLYLKNPKSAAAAASFVGTVEDGTGSISVAPGACVQVISDGQKWVPI